jgi:steroid Delta-isomerase
MIPGGAILHRPPARVSADEEVTATDRNAARNGGRRTALDDRRSETRFGYSDCPRVLRAQCGRHGSTELSDANSGVPDIGSARHRTARPHLNGPKRETGDRLDMTTEEQQKNVHEGWHKAIVSRNLDRLMEFYAPDAVLDSTAVLVLEKDPSGIIRGKDNIRKHFAGFFAMLPPSDGKDWYRLRNYHWDGKTVLWEYPSAGPDGDQLDVVESFDLNRGLIAYHRVYWGRVGFKMLTDAAKK